MRKKRPIVVTFLSACLIFWGVVGFLLLTFNHRISIEMDLSADCGITGSIWRNFGVPGLRVEMAPLCLSAAIVGIGLLRLLSWARTALMLACCVDVVLAIVAMLEMLWKRSCTSVTFTSAFFSALVFVYFARKKIKILFASLPAASESSV